MAEQRNGLYKEILLSHSDDRKIIYKLINKQKYHKQFSISELFVDDEHVTLLLLLLLLLY